VLEGGESQSTHAGRCLQAVAPLRLLPPSWQQLAAPHILPTQAGKQPASRPLRSTQASRRSRHQSTLSVACSEALRSTYERGYWQAANGRPGRALYDRSASFPACLQDAGGEPWRSGLRQVRCGCAQRAGRLASLAQCLHRAPEPPARWWPVPAAGGSWSAPPERG
jgi:hypothetical protein